MLQIRGKILYCSEVKRIFSSSNSNAVVPSIIQQYMQFERQYPNKLIAMQVGDFFEFFGPHATSASTLLDLALGHRNGLPFTGFPTRSLDTHLPKLIKMGREVVVCEQFREKFNASVFRRKVTRVLTPGTNVESSEQGNNFLLAIKCSESNNNRFVDLAWADVGTGELYYQNDLPVEFLTAEIKRIGPSEVISNTPGFKLYEKGKSAIEMIQLYIQEQNPSSEQDSAEVSLMDPREMIASSYMAIDPTDSKALDLFDSENSLFECLDECLTASGSRLLRHRLQYPSMHLEVINQRLDEVEFYLSSPQVRELMREGLKGITDIERCLQRLMLCRGTPRDLNNLIRGLLQLHNLQEVSNDLLQVVQDIKTALEENLPMRIMDGQVIREGFDEKLDQLRNSGSCVNQDAAKLIQDYRELTGKDCKLGVMRTGYFVEYPRSQGPITIADITSGFYPDASTNTKCRYRTKELDTLFMKAERGTEEAKAYEICLYEKLIQKLLAKKREIQQVIRWMAQVDLATTGAHIASTRGYSRPRISLDGISLKVVGGRHPVVEWILNKQGRDFTENDLEMNEQKFAFITGPNMGGKSTYLRQNALLLIMAQGGLFIPAAEFSASAGDLVLTRIGAGDDLTNDRSTFMQEMSEAARILRRATARSFVVVDELGRGTRPEEGTAIAAAVAKELVRLGCRCLFATHLQSIKKHISSSSSLCSGGVLYLKSVGGVREDGGLLVDHRIVPGVSEDACALGVARVAGIPPNVLNDAECILSKIEQ